MSEKDILNYFINAGYSKAAASAIVGTLMSESSLRHDAVNKNSGAYGYALWLGNRKKELFKRYGEHPTAQNQLDYILWELLNTHRPANDVLKNSLDINQLVDAMFGNYEFSAGKKKAILAMNNSGLNGEASLADKLKHSINTYNRYYGNISPYRAVDPNGVQSTQYFDNAPRKVLTGRVVQSPDGLYSIVDKNVPSTIAYENADRAYRMTSSPTLNAPIVLANPETIAGPVLQDVNVYGRPKSPRLSVPSLMDTHRQYLNYLMLKNAGMIDEDDNDDFYNYMMAKNVALPRFEGGKDGVKWQTTGGAGYFPDQPPFIKNLNPPKSKEEARLRLYNKVAPYWGFTDDTMKAFIETILYGDNAFSRSVGKPDVFGKPNPPIAIEDPYIDGVWAEYLQIPENKRRSKYKLLRSKYRPTIGDEDTSYYTIPIDSVTKDAIVEDAMMLPIGKNKLSTILMGYNHGDHTIGHGIDKKHGLYVSYYDRWDLNPLSSTYSDTKLKNNSLIKKLGLMDNRKHGDLSFGLGRPIDFYDRIYLDDYYGVDSSARPGTYYGGWLPEIFVTSFGDGVTNKKMGKISYTDTGNVLLTPINK